MRKPKLVTAILPFAVGALAFFGVQATGEAIATSVAPRSIAAFAEVQNRRGNRDEVALGEGEELLLHAMVSTHRNYAIK